MNHLSQQNIATHLTKLHKTQEKIKLDFLAKQKSISFTTNAWTAPNVKAVMAVTAHYIDKKFKIVDLTIAIPNVQGRIFFFIFIAFDIELSFLLVEEYNLMKKIHTITADNASTNTKMAVELQKLLSFDPKNGLLGCMAHFINLGAKAGLAVLGKINDNIGNEISLGAEDSEGHNFNLKTVHNCIHRLCTYVQFSPQQRNRFQTVVNFAQPELGQSGAKFTCLDIDVSTCFAHCENTSAQIIAKQLNTFYQLPSGLKHQITWSCFYLSARQLKFSTHQSNPV
ncbi:uncharacterized protein VP01_2810g1 [Puccinia sorghi]|uniref:DUF659 domain-containing protein n=1 Tax=Puccinia sorghi TaxID=27349 RepID=A0A0L6V486_9BASI|nr:uncharacterized protein VP01_2810g1 [Puccinia sorghi]